jgi:amino acid transporter
MGPDNQLPPGVPSQKAQSWGTVISIIIIVLMIIIGAFYSWGKRIAEQNAFVAPTTEQQ